MEDSKNIALVKSIYSAFGAGTGDNLKVLDLVTEDIDWMLREWYDTAEMMKAFRSKSLIQKSIAIRQ